jgi:hypothetical protein
MFNEGKWSPIENMDFYKCQFPFIIHILRKDTVISLESNVGIVSEQRIEIDQAENILNVLSSTNPELPW